MHNVITWKNLRSFAHLNDALLAGPPRGLAVEFGGLGAAAMLDKDTRRGEALARQDVLLAIPYLNPWAWMNRQAVDTTDEIITAVLDHWGVPEAFPLISIGGSMGGLSALVYARYARRTPTACVVNCPVCDLPYHYTERPDLPRTLYSAFGAYPGSLEEAMATASPLHLAAEMPDIDYTFFHCLADQAVNPARHTARLVAALGELGRRVTYYTVPDRGHCDLTPEMRDRYDQAIVAATAGYAPGKERYGQE